MRLFRYNAPLVPAYRSRDFQASTRDWGPRILQLATTERGFVRPSHSPWINYMPHELGARPASRRKRHGWQPKVYLCLAPQHYWSTLQALIEELAGGSLRWKFFHDTEEWERPDKLVFYPSSPDELQKVVSMLERHSAGKETHNLRHTAPSVALGFGREDNGVFLGCDPSFLRHSWRFYRTLVIAWADLNAEYLESLPRGGMHRWMERMNIASQHEGPAKLRPPSEDEAYVRRYWDEVFAPAREAALERAGAD